MNIDKSKATIVISKFQEIEKETREKYREAEQPSSHGDSTNTRRIWALMDGFSELCKLLHEIIMED